jgi:cell division protein FtsQ
MRSPTVEWQVAGACNYDCSYCIQKKATRKGRPDAERVAAAVWVGARRWDLRLDNGVAIRLPETGVESALARLAAAQAKSPFLDRDVVAVDLRQTDRLVVQLGPAAAERMRPPPPANRRS